MMACASLKANWTWPLKTVRLPKLVLSLYRIHTFLQSSNKSHMKSILGSKCHASLPQFRPCHPRALFCTLKIIILPNPALLHSLFQCQPLHTRSNASHQLPMICSDLPNTSWLWITIDNRLITNHVRQRLWSSQYMLLWARTFFSFLCLFLSLFQLRHIW